MEYILVNKAFINGKKVNNGYYAGKNKKYADSFDLVPERKFAKIFILKEDAQKQADDLNNAGWNFEVEPTKKIN